MADETAQATTQSSQGTGAQQTSAQSGAAAAQTSAAASGQQSAAQTQQTQTAQTQPARPDWLPPNFFDDKSGPKWDDFGKHFAEVATRDAAEQVRRSALPAKPEDYKVATTAGFKPPEGVEFKIDENNPLWAQGRAWAHKYGLSQQAFEEAIDLVGGNEVANATVIKSARDAEIAKLGTNGPAQVTAVNQFLDGLGVPGLKARMLTAQDVRDWQRVISNFSSQGAASFSSAHRDPQTNGGLVTEEQWGKMSAAERLDYTRSPAAVAARARSN